MGFPCLFFHPKITTALHKVYDKPYCVSSMIYISKSKEALSFICKWARNTVNCRSISWFRHKRSERVNLAVRPAVLIAPFYKGVTIGQTQVSLKTLLMPLIMGGFHFMQGTRIILTFTSLVYYKCPGRQKEHTHNECYERHLCLSYEDISMKKAYEVKL